MTEEIKVKKSRARSKAETIVEMTKEAKRIEQRLGAKACIVICFFEEPAKSAIGMPNITVQDAGRFPMPPAQFYEIMIRAHSQGMLDQKPKSKILRPN